MQKTAGRQNAINTVVNIISFIANAAITFFLTSYIVNTIGKEAYGFVGLSLNIINIMQILVTAFNSVAGRFILLHIQRQDFESAKKYYSTILLANLMLNLLFLAVFALIIVFLNNLFDIPGQLYGDVRLLFIFIFASYLLGVATSIFAAGAFSKNRMDIQALKNVSGNLIRAAVLVVFYLLLPPKVWYFGFAALIMSIFIGLYDYYYKSKHTPFLKLASKEFDPTVVRLVLLSGLWNSLALAGTTINTGFDLIWANLFIGSAAMGTLSVSRTIPIFIQNFSVSLSASFLPNYTGIFGMGDTDKLSKTVLSNMKLIALVGGAIIACLIALSDEFYLLWIAGEETLLLSRLSIITLVSFALSCPMEPLAPLFTAIGKMKVNAISLLINSVIIAVSVVVLLLNSNFGLYAIVTVSAVFNILRSVVFLPIYASLVLKKSKAYFYPLILKNIIAIAITITAGLIIKQLLGASSWILLIINAAVIGVVGLVVYFIIVLSRSERKMIIAKLKQMLRLSA